MGNTTLFNQAVNKTLAPAEFHSFANGLTLANNNGYGLFLNDDTALSSNPIFTVANASASDAVQGLTLAGNLSGGTAGAACLLAAAGIQIAVMRSM